MVNLLLNIIMWTS